MRGASAAPTPQHPTNLLISWISILPVPHHTQLAASIKHGKVRSRSPPRGCRGRLRPRRARRAHPHLPLRLRRRRLRHGNRQAGRRRGLGGGPDGGGAGPHAGGRRHGVRGAPRLRRPHQPGRDAGPGRHRPHHSVPLGALRPRPAAGLRPRLPPPHVPHRRRAHARARAGGRGGCRARGGHGGGAHLLAALRGVRHRRGPAPRRGGHGPASRGPRRRRQRARRRAFLRRVHEPGTLLRAGARGWCLGRPLGVLGRSADWWASSWADL